MADALMLQLRSIDKVSVLQEARMFHDPRLSTKKCINVLSKLLLIINQGQSLTSKEATDVFFAITRLIQSKDTNLRYIVYICIKELAKLASDVLIMTSSIIQDITSKNGTFRSQAIRALWKITDANMMPSVERYMKQAIVSSSPLIASAALVSTVQLAAQGSADLIKRWSNEILQAISTDCDITQYHALAAMCMIRQGDKVALTKLINHFVKSNSRSSYANVLMIRVVTEILGEELSAPFCSKSIWDEPLFAYIQNCLHHRYDMVVIEAASCISRLPNVPSLKIAKTVSALQRLLSSDKLLCRFSAVRILNKLADSYADIVAICNTDLEAFLRSTNRSTCTLAITTLLKTSDESAVDQLLQQISGFMTDMTDEHRTAVVDAIRILTLKKHHAASKFLGNMLREEGGMEFKESVVSALSNAMKLNTSTRAYGLAKLCEFIEDCEYENLTTKILYLLGSEAIKNGLSSQHIRYIYNRVILESPIVRSAAITALARIAASESKYRKRVLALLKQSLFDDDDGVRDRAAFFYSILEEIDTNSSLDESSTDQLLKYITSSASQVAQPISNIPSPEPFSLPQKIDICTRVSTRGLGDILKSSYPTSLTEPELEYQVRCVKHLFANHIILEYLIENTLDTVNISNVSIDVAPESPSFSVIETLSIPLIRCHETKSALCLLQFTGDAMDEGTSMMSNQMNFTVTDVDVTDDTDAGYAENLHLEDTDIVVGNFMVYHEVPDFDMAFETMKSMNSFEQSDAFMLPQKSLADVLTRPCQRMRVSAFLYSRIFDRQMMSRSRLRSLKMVRCENYLKRVVGERLADRALDIKRDTFQRVCDLWCDFGFCARHLPPAHELILADISSEFTSTAHQACELHDIKRQVVVDLEDETPMFPQCDLIVANLAMQWLNDPLGFLQAMNSRLMPDGVFLASLFVNGTLQELGHSLQNTELQMIKGVHNHLCPMLNRSLGTTLYQKCQMQGIL